MGVGVTVGAGVSVGVSEIETVTVGVIVGVTPGTEFCSGKKYSAPLIETLK